MSTLPKTHLTPEEYLEIERKAEFKSEYRQGQMVAMRRAGAEDWPPDRPRRPGEKFDLAKIGEAHSLIAANVIGRLGEQLRPGPWRLYATDMRLYVRGAELYTYPDVMAAGSDRQFLDDRRDTLLNPILIVEVFTPPSEANDRCYKAEHYRSIESLRIYLMVASHYLHATLFTRRSDGKWVLAMVNRAEDALALSAVDCVIRLGDLYDKVEL